MVVGNIRIFLNVGGFVQSKKNIVIAPNLNVSHTSPDTYIIYYLL